MYNFLCNPHKGACYIINVEEKLNSKHNDTFNKHITDSLNKFVNVYKSLDETKMSIAKKHLILVVQMHHKNQTFQLWPHELNAQVKERAEDLNSNYSA